MHKGNDELLLQLHIFCNCISAVALLIAWLCCGVIFGALFWQERARIKSGVKK